MNLLLSQEEIKQRLEDSGIDLPENDFKYNSKANLLWLDDALAALNEKLEKLGIAENTIIFFFNDHGQNAKGTIYQGGVRNPSLVWKKGGFATGDDAFTRVSNIDFAPTILDMAGVDYSEDTFDGKSFLPVLNGDPDPIHESLYFEMGYTRGILKGDMKYLALRYPEKAQNMSLKERKKRLERLNSNLRRRGYEPMTEDPTEPFSHNSLIPGGGHAEHKSTGEKPNYYDHDQLYNIHKDPMELHNLAEDPAYDQELKQMQDELRDYIDELPGHFKLK